MYYLLIADDKSDIIEVFKKAFEEKKDYTVFYAKDGLEAFQISKKQKLDLIITDIQMPKVNGSQLVIALHQQKMNADVPIIVITGQVDKAKQELKDFEGIKYIAKPFSLNPLMAEIEKILEHREIQKSRSVDVRFINALIDSTISVLQSFGGCKEIKNQPIAKINEITNWPAIDISGIIHLNSDKFNGEIVVSFNKEIFLMLVNHILGENFQQITAENNDAAGEIANIILGQAKTKWNQLKATVSKYSVKVSADQLHKLVSSMNEPGLFIPFETNIGNFYILISFAVKTPKAESTQASA